MVHYVIMERNILERLATRTLSVCQTILINMKKNNVKPTFNKLLSYKWKVQFGTKLGYHVAIDEEVKPKLGIKQDQISTVDSEGGVLNVSPSSEEIENHAELTLC